MRFRRAARPGEPKHNPSLPRPARSLRCAALLLASFAVACGGDDKKAAPPPETDGGVTLDTTPPTFGGVTSVADGDEGGAIVSWAPATDDVTRSESIVYVVYRASTTGSQDFSAARRCGSAVADAGALARTYLPCFKVAPAGSTRTIVKDATPGQTYYYVVRAVDAAGNRDANVVESAWLSADGTAPEFTGVRGVNVLSPTSIEVIWNSAYDIGTPDPALTFEVWVSTGTPDPATETPTLVSQPGEHEVTVTGLTPSTTYTIMVRAKDAAGNQDPNTRTITITTPEGNPPAFVGAGQAAATGTTMRVFWLPATDDTTDPDNVMYDVYEAKASHQQNFAVPSYTSLPGASSIVIPNLLPGITYYYVVRARDAAGNQDTNVKQVQATTGGIPDTRPPTFLGVTNVTSESPTSLKVTWTTAADDFSANEDITYLVYVSSASQLPLAATATPTATIRGATTITLGGFSPASTHYVVVRARDLVGNTLASGDVERNAQTLSSPVTPDTTPPSTPVSGSNYAATQVVSPATRLNVAFPTATDDVDGAADIRYLLCASTVQTDCVGSSFSTHITTATGWGATTATLSFLTPRTTYFVVLRAEDRSGNVETNVNSVTATTATSWKTNVAPILFDRCIACHDYDQPSGIVSKASSYNEDQACALGTPPGTCQLLLVDPGRPEFSYIYRKINPLGLTTTPFSPTVPNSYAGVQMPRDTSAKLTGEEDDALKDWITEGALSN